MSASGIERSAKRAVLDEEEIMAIGTSMIGRLGALAATFGFCLIIAGPVFADGGGGGSNDSSTCQPGEVYDSRQWKCVKRQAGVLPDKALAEYAYVLAKAERYDEALAVLNTMKNPNTAEAWNYRGYATRKLGRVDEGIGYYLKSVKLAPRYAQVREYLGEAYVIKGDLARAKAQLNVIKSICGTECEPYEDLAKAISSGGKES
jgi:tetratricopeptide (TPR) repeat protein